MMFEYEMSALSEWSMSTDDASADTHDGSERSHKIIESLMRTTTISWPL